MPARSLQPGSPGTETPETAAARAHLLAELQRYDEAAVEYDKLLELRPHYAEGYYQGGACLYRLGKHAEALQRFTKAAELDPAHLEAQLVKGICLLHLKRPEEALEAFGKCLEKSPGLEAALLGKGVALQLAWEFDEAVEVYEQVLRRNPKCDEAAANLIALGMQRKDYALVRKQAELLLARDGSAQAALEGLSTAAFTEGNFAESAGYYCRLVELYPRNYDYWFNLGVTYQKMGKPLDAAAAYQNAASLRPDATSAHINLAAVYHEMGDLAASRQALEAALVVAPERTDLRYQRAVAIEEQGFLDQAEALYGELAEKECPEFENAQFRGGYLKLQRGDYQGAANCLQACLQKRPAWSGAELNLALAYWKLGKFAESQDVLVELLRREPGNLEAVRGMSANALQQQDTADALRWHLRLQELGDRSAEALPEHGDPVPAGGRNGQCDPDVSGGDRGQTGLRRSAAQSGPCAGSVGRSRGSSGGLGAGAGDQAGAGARVLLERSVDRSPVGCAGARDGSRVRLL